MSKLLLPLSCLCLVAWLFGGSIWFGKHYAKENVLTAWTLQDGKNQFHSPTMFSFQKSDAEIILDENQHRMLSQIAQYLMETSSRHLQIEGLYTKSEENNSNFDNIGKARAESFKYLLYRQGVALKQLHSKGKVVKKHKLNANDLIDGGVEFTFVESPLAKYGTSFDIEKKIEFEGDSEDDIRTKDLDSYLAQVRQYLVDHPNQKVHLTGFSNSVEENANTRKRVFTIENILTKNEIPKEKFESHMEESGESESAYNYVEIRIY